MFPQASTASRPDSCYKGREIKGKKKGSQTHSGPMGVGEGVFCGERRSGTSALTRTSSQTPAQL